MTVTEKNNLWLDLLNSDWHDYRGSGRREDRLTNRAWLRKYLASRLAKLKNVEETEIIGGLRRLRTFIYRMVDALHGGRKIADKDWRALAAVLSAVPLRRRLAKTASGYSLELAAVSDNLQAFLAEIAASFAETLIHGDLSRIKICANPDCVWFFYDQSKNRSRRWCEGDGGCGNLMKVRRFRAKRKPARRAKK